MASSSVLLERYQRVRQRSLRLCAPLSAEDAQIQSMPDASPAKWHLAHTTWFFETFVLATVDDEPLDPSFAFLFNSYYDAVGARVDRARRGLVTRPPLAAVHAYRYAIDTRIQHALIEKRFAAPALAALEIGLHHEQQHQELLLTDIKHALGTQPLVPSYRDDLVVPPRAVVSPLAWIDIDGGTIEIGAADETFAFDCERPRHHVIVEPYRLATRPVCNAEVLAFLADGGYQEPRFWLSDGWTTVQHEHWEAPLYWQHDDGAWMIYTLGGLREVEPAETACHLSYYEADAIARWAGARLPSEAEWEHAAARLASADTGHFADDDVLQPRAAGTGMSQLYGDVWEWTQSAFAPYPGFAPLPGALGEYNGKFMASQLVLRGGSCLTPRDHVRASYRNFFPPSARWQMSGVRLAADGGSP
jgi:ergothioneine biosynthesis protein EgtB